MVIIFFNVGVLIKNDIGNGESMDEDIEPLNLGLKISSYVEKGNIFKLSNWFWWSEYSKHISLDTGRKWNLHKTFRRLPGRLLNVSCTFNLRPVSNGIIMNVMIMAMIIMRMISNWQQWQSNNALPESAYGKGYEISETFALSGQILL